MKTLVHWRHLVFRLGSGSLLQMGLFLSLSLVFVPDLGDASFAARSFLGSLVKAYPWAFARGALPGLLEAALVGLCLQLCLLGLGFLARCFVPLALAFLVLLRMATDHPALASEWFVFQRSSTFQLSVGFLSNLEPESLVRTLINWAPFALVACIAVANLTILGRWVLAQQARFQKLSRGFRMEELDLQSRRYAMAGVAFGASLMSGAFGLSFLWPLPLRKAPWPPDRIAKPHVFLIWIDGLRPQMLSPANHEREWMPFLSQKSEEAEFRGVYSVGAAEALASWMEVQTCQSVLRTKVRGLFPNRGHWREPPEDFVSYARKQGYSTFLAADFVGAYLNQMPLSFERVRAPALTLSQLAANSFLRTAAPLQGLGVLPRFRGFHHALALNPGFADSRYLVSDFLSLLETAAADDKPVLGTLIFSEPYSVLRSDFPFLQHPNQRSFTSIQAYKRSVEKLDSQLKLLWESLEKAGWLENSVVVVAGLRGFDFKERAPLKKPSRFFSDQELTENLAFPRLESESEMTSPLFVWTAGKASESERIGLESRMARTVDLAPTLAKRMGLTGFAFDKCDGAPLLDLIDKTAMMSADGFYQESSTLQAMETLALGGRKKPWEIPFAEWIRLDEGLEGRFFFRPGVEETLLQMRSRAWQTPTFRYVETFTPEGLRPGLFDRRTDAMGEWNLLGAGRSSDLQDLDSREATTIALELQGHLWQFLGSQGIPWKELSTIPAGFSAPLAQGLYLENSP
jgi:hypothetical protein